MANEVVNVVGDELVNELVDEVGDEVVNDALLVQDYVQVGHEQEGDA